MTIENLTTGGREGHRNALNQKKLRQYPVGFSFCLIVIVLASWCLALQYRGASDFTDTLGYMAQAKYLSNDRQFNPARISWENFTSGEGNLSTTMHYPGQFFSLAIGMVAKILGSPLDMWMIIAFNCFVYVLCCLLCLLFLARHLRGWEFLLIGFFSLTNFFVMAACVSTLTDGLGFAFLLLALCLSSQEKKRSFLVGLVFGVSFFVRTHLAIFALFFPLLLFDRFNKHAIRCTALYVLGICCAYGTVLGCLKLYVVPPPPPQTVLQYAQTQGVPFVVPEENHHAHEQSKTTDNNKSFSTFGWYYRQISASLSTLKQYGVGWMTLGLYQTLGPASWCFGPLFFAIVISLLFRWSHPIITRYSLYVVGTLFTFYCAAYTLLIPGPSETMIAEFKTLGRYFCYFFPLIPLLFWLIVRELIPPEMKFFPLLERMKQKVFGQTMDSRLMMTGILFCFVFPNCFGIWGYGAALLAKMPVRQGTVVFQGDDILRRELSVFTSESMVMSSRCDAVQVFSSIRHVVQSPMSPDNFLQNKNNHLLDALVLFPKAMNATIKMSENDKAQWLEVLNNDLITDEQGNQFLKVYEHSGEGANDEARNRRAFVIYRRLGSFGFNPESL